jgi:hypothetical protein
MGAIVSYFGPHRLEFLEFTFEDAAPEFLLAMERTRGFASHLLGNLALREPGTPEAALEFLSQFPASRPSEPGEGLVEAALYDLLCMRDQERLARIVAQARDALAAVLTAP